MRTIVLDITDSNVTYHIELDRRINFIKGNSGVGKTTIVDIINDSVNDSSIKLSCNYNYLPVRQLTWQDDIRTKRNTLLIFDDMEIVSLPSFASLVKEYTIKNDLCFLIMTREDSDDLSSVGRLSFSIGNIYKIVTEDGVHVLKRYYNFPKYDGLYDLCLTEDTSAGFQFYSRLISSCEVVSSTGGKSTIISDVLGYINSGKYNSILVILDTSAFGCHIEELYSRVKNKSCNVSIITSYECFEELLVRTNLVNKLDLVKMHMSDLNNYANKYVSWETYFEKLLDEATKNTFYHHAHNSKLKECYYKDCADCNVHKRNKCVCVLDGTKFEELLRGTKYEFLLNI